MAFFCPFNIFSDPMYARMIVSCFFFVCVGVYVCVCVCAPLSNALVIFRASICALVLKLLQFHTVFYLDIQLAFNSPEGTSVEKVIFLFFIFLNTQFTKRALSTSQLHTHTCTHTYIFLYILSR